MNDLHAHPEDVCGAPHRTRLEGLAGRKYWRSLDELSGTPEFERFLHREFPEAASEWFDPVSRRGFLRLMAASIALAGLTGCTEGPSDKIVPYVAPPEQVVPGKPLFFATAMPWNGYARGVLAESHMGRPTKIEGNPDHPASLGSTDLFMQASVLDLWDPDRAQTVTRAGEVATWPQLVAALRKFLADNRMENGDGLGILTPNITSPTLAWQFQQLFKRYPQARWHVHEPVGEESAVQGAVLAFGRPVNTIYRLDRATRILSLDSNFLFDSPGSLRYAREFIDGRRVRQGRTQMNRLYSIHSAPSITSAMADHRLVVRASEVENITREIAAALGISSFIPHPSSFAPWIAALVEDLKQHAGSSVVIPGLYATPATHAIAHAINERLGNVGKTVIHTEPVVASATARPISELVREMNSGQVKVLLILGANPVFTAPADLEFARAMEKVPLRIHHSLYYDETSFHCHWHVPESHYLESWSDARAYDGTATIIQPLIAPLYQSRTVHQVIGALLGEDEPSALAPVQQYWRSVHHDNFEPFWNESLSRGVVEASASPPIQVKVREDSLKTPATQPATRPKAEELEIIFRPDPSLWDGRFANNGWLQELPRHVTRLTWDNPAMISPRTADRMRLKNGQIVELSHAGRTLRIPIWITPGQPDGSVTLYLGGGRQRAGRIGTATDDGGGFNVYTLRSSQNPWFDDGLHLTPTSDDYRLANTQLHQTMDGVPEELLHVIDIDHFAPTTPTTQESPRRVPLAPYSIYPEYDYSTGHQWGMVIDNNACIGCNACVIACQAENNIPIVGKKEVLNSRQMHWLRIDTYHAGDPGENPETYFEPIPCMHCETAPCEVVCPVAATTHSVEGLNEMTYNRCVGTRYCSNNCPYKVRRFNFFHYAKPDSESVQLGRNPDVTVRARGVMEKCTYCVQRINHTRIDLKKMELELSQAATPEEKQRLRKQMDAELSSLQTACAQACPTQAIIFGDLNHRYRDDRGQEQRSLVWQLKQQPQNYGLLTELNTQPRTTYLPRFRNPNPRMPKEEYA